MTDRVREVEAMRPDPLAYFALCRITEAIWELPGDVVLNGQAATHALLANPQDTGARAYLLELVQRWQTHPDYREEWAA